MRKALIKTGAFLACISILFGIASCSASSKSGTIETPPSSETTSITTTESVIETETETSTETGPETETETTIEETTESESETTATTPAATAKATTKATQKTVKNLSPKWVRSLAHAKNKKIKQMIIVAGSGMNKTTATVSMHERDKDGNWIRIMSVSGYVGKNGLVLDSKRKEGSKQTPIGVYTIDKAFGIASDPGCAIPYTKVTNDLYWSGDMRKGMHYNKMVSINDCPKLDKKNSEHLIDFKKPYQYCLNIGFNKKCVLGKGSAIFLHCKGDHNYTAGCISVSKSNMLKIMKRVKPGCVVIINTKAKLGA